MPSLRQDNLLTLTVEALRHKGQPGGVVAAGDFPAFAGAVGPAEVGAVFRPRFQGADSGLLRPPGVRTLELVALATPDLLGMASAVDLAHFDKSVMVLGQDLAWSQQGSDGSDDD